MNELESKWVKRTVKHREKFHKLFQLPPSKISKIGTFNACFDREFKIGEGRDGTCVYIGLSDDGNEVAIKRMLTHACEDLAENEKRILNMMKMEKSEHIVRYRYCETDERSTFTYLVLELCEETLAEYVASISQEQLHREAPRLIREILNGLLVLHGTGDVEKILHMDLKPRNILVDIEGRMRLADFGVSRRLSQNSSTVNTGGKDKGARYWRARESVPEDDDDAIVKFKRKSDIQVAGMVSYHILTKGGHPFGAVYSRVRNLIDGKPVDLNPEKLPDPVARDFLSWLLQHEIADRPFAEEALMHPFLQSREQQFAMLVHFGNETEIKDKDPSCVLFKELDEDALLSNINWKGKIDHDVLEHMERCCKYDNSVAALLRFMRNANEHRNDKKTPRQVKEKLANPADYFLTKFPVLAVVVHRVVRTKVAWSTRPDLKGFFKLK